MTAQPDMFAPPPPTDGDSDTLLVSCVTGMLAVKADESTTRSVKNRGARCAYCKERGSPGLSVERARVQWLHHITFECPQKPEWFEGPTHRRHTD